MESQFHFWRWNLTEQMISHSNVEEIANEVFPLERAVTPFSEYKLRLGIVARTERCDDEYEPVKPPLVLRLTWMTALKQNIWRNKEKRNCRSSIHAM